MLLRVSTYAGELVSVILKDADSPATVIDTFTGADLVDTGGGAYTVDIGSITGRWLLVLQDENDETMGLFYASNDYPYAADYPQWLEEQPSYGPYLATIVILDEDDNPLSGVSVRLIKAAQSTVDESNGDGETTFSLGAGTWQILISSPGYAYTPESITISDDVTHTITLTALATDQPDDPMLCIVDYYVWGDEAPLEGAKVLVKIDNRFSVTNSYLVSQAVHAATTDENGYARLQLIRKEAFDEGGDYSEEIHDSRGKLISRRVIRVPNLSYTLASQLEIVE